MIQRRAADTPHRRKEIRNRLIRIDRSGYQGRAAETDIGKDSE